jgi:DNA primase
MGGTAIDWVMKANGISFRHAVELLKADHLPLAAEPIQPVKQSTVRKLPPPVARDADDRALLLQVTGYYNEALKQSPEAMKYLESRGLKSSEIIDRFRLGFANRTLGYRLPAKNRAAGAEMRGRLQELGIYRKSGHEHFNGSIVVPIFDSTGAVVEMYGRKITANLREGTPDHLYLKGQHRGVWNEEALAASKEIVLCEALIDALTFWVAGIRQVTASYGVNGFTDDHRRAFERHGTGLHRLRPRRSGRQGSGGAGPGVDRDGHRMLPCAVPEGHGRERIRAEGNARIEEPECACKQGRVAGQGAAGGGASDRSRASRSKSSG